MKINMYNHNTLLVATELPSSIMWGGYFITAPRTTRAEITFDGQTINLKAGQSYPIGRLTIKLDNGTLSFERVG